MTREPYHPQPVSVRVTPWARDRLAEKATEQGVDVSDVVRAAVDEYLSHQGAGLTEMDVQVPRDREPRSSFAVVLTPEWLKEVEFNVRRMGMTLGESMRAGPLHLVREHMPEMCALCGGRKEDRRTYCKPWGHDIQCLHKFHFDDEDAWLEATGAAVEPQEFPDLTPEERAVVGQPEDYAWGDAVHVVP